MTLNKKGFLHLSTGKSFKGSLFGDLNNEIGELVFTTALTGYTETLTDPSFHKQALVFTYPLLGNYGIPNTSHSFSNSSIESDKVHVSSVIVNKLGFTPETETATKTDLSKWLKENKTSGISEIDTRELTHIIRSNNNLFGYISNNPLNRFKNTISNNITEDCLIKNVSTDKVKKIGSGKITIAIVDCGTKWNIIRSVLKLDCTVLLIPWNSDLKNIKCDGFILSNGPGNPEYCKDLCNRVKEILSGNTPILGVCLGNQILGLAAGAKTEKLPFGHRGHNHPVKDLFTNMSFITSQNHGYSLKANSLPSSWEVWFENINDKSIEGIRHKKKPFFGIQFHPEASAGPEDTAWIFRDFINIIIKELSHEE